VDIEITHPQDKEGVITNIYPRKNQMLRPKVSNIDQSILVFSVTNPPINFDLLDRLTILSEEQNLDIIIVFNKIDLISEIPRDIKTLYESIGYKTIFTSIETGQGIAELENNLKNKVSVFCGASGVGKSSLVNSICPRANMEVGVVSAKGKRGKHTTRYSNLVPFKGGYIVDSPGFTSLFFNFEPLALANYFKEFRPFLDNCRFPNCSHISEPDCGIKEVLGMEISENRYERYKSLYRELIRS